MTSTDSAAAATPDIRAGRLDAAQYRHNFCDAHPPLTLAQARIEADRCYYCFEAPCQTACPTGIDVPSFIQRIADNNIRGSAHAILSANPLGGMCARVCPTEVLCEQACVRNTHEDKPVEIGQLQRYATDAYLANPGAPLFTPRQGQRPQGGRRRRRTGRPGLRPWSGAPRPRRGRVRRQCQTRRPQRIRTGDLQDRRRTSRSKRSTGCCPSAASTSAAKTELGRDVSLEQLVAGLRRGIPGHGTGRRQQHRYRRTRRQRLAQCGRIHRRTAPDARLCHRCRSAGAWLSSAAA